MVARYFILLESVEAIDEIELHKRPFSLLI
jgi:hypothetical protein